MSEFREDLLITKINKKRIIGIILVSTLLLSVFAFSILLSSLIFDSQRPFPSDRLSEAEEEEGIRLITAPFPFNFSDFLDLNLTQDQLSDLLDMLQDMFDGDIDDLDLGNYSQGIAALFTSEIEVFRVYDYEDFDSMSQKLWRYECFDEYTGDGWHSTAASQYDSFYSYEDYYFNHWDKDLMRIKMPLTPSYGINSMVIPNLFPTPFIMDGSLFAPNMDSESAELYRDEFNCTIVDLNFYDSVDVNMSYDLFGLNLPANEEINSTAFHASYTPTEIQNRFTQLPPNIPLYLAENSHVYEDYLNLDSLIFPYDNAFVVANKIRNYLQYQFAFSDPESYTPPPEGRDTVDYFCETREGIWTEFASAFCVFTRIFGVASRFVDGFNSLLIEQIRDNEENKDTFAIKYKNIYNWAEVFVPTDTSGNGQWVQMDVLFDSYGGNPWSPSVIYNNVTDYNLTVTSNFKSGYRMGQNAKITATLSQYGMKVQGEELTFIDLATDNIIGTAYTDIYGNASIFISIDNTQVVGPHHIVASYNPQIFNHTRYDIYGDLYVQLIDINPQSLNISISTFTDIQGYLIDTLNNVRVRNAQVEFVLLYKGTNTKALPFSPNYMVSGINGEFDTRLYVDPSLSVGEYQVRVDFNSTFIDPFYFSTINLPSITSVSSSRLDFNITKGSKVIHFYINDFPSSDPTSPSVNRSSNVRLKAFVHHETYGPLSGQLIEFYDYTNGNFIDSSYTNSTGYATIDYFVDYQAKSGPNLLYAKLGMQLNYSYFILNDAPTIHIFSGPTPRVINRTGGGYTSFNVIGEITDTYDRSNKLGFSEIRLQMLKAGESYSSYLIPYDSYPFQTNSEGFFDIDFGVAPNTPTGNYTLRIDFNGTIYLNQIGHPYPYSFILPELSNSTFLEYEIQITTPATLKFDFWIDGHDVYDYDQPIINRNGKLNLSVYIEWGDPLDDADIEFYDLTQGIWLGTVQTFDGRASIIYNTNTLTVAGPHLIYARWGSNYNYSYFTLNDNITLDVTLGPSPNLVSRGGETFNIKGSVIDALNGAPIKFPEIYIALLDDDMNDVSFHLSSNLFHLNESGTFDLTLSLDNETAAKNYTINVNFYGAFIYSWPNNQFNQFNFDFDYVSNFTCNDDANFKLKVIDPFNITIQFEIDGHPALSYYDDLPENLPERYNKGDPINFSVHITQGGEDVTDGTVILTDVYINSQIGSYTFNSADNGRHYFIIYTTSWHAGLHKIRVQWASFPAINYTYIIINDTVSISIDPFLESIQRKVDAFNVFGTVQDGSVNLQGLNIKLRFLDHSLNDVSGYLNLADSQFITIQDGSFQFDINFISIDCPQGLYYFKIDFNGSISEEGISLTDYMVHSSSLIPVNITAGTYIVGNYDTTFWEGQDIYAYGYLYWDNNSLVTGPITITVDIEDGMGGILTTEIDFTDDSGWFNISIYIDPSWAEGLDEFEVWASFDPIDSYIESTRIELFLS